jgi:hypothetical protein
MAVNQLGRLVAAGLAVKWVASDEVYGRSEELRTKAARAGLAYVAIFPCDYRVGWMTPGGFRIRWLRGAAGRCRARGGVLRGG